MVKAKCLQKIRGKNKQILGYRLQDTKGIIRDFNSTFVKEQIKTGNLRLVNLTLTSDNRLVDSTQETPNKKKIDTESILKIIQKAKLLGRAKDIPTACGHNCYLVSKTDTEHIIYIPDNVTQLNMNDYERPFTDEICDLKGSIKVIGGTGLKDTQYMFDECEVQSLDLSNLDTSNVWNMECMFLACKVKALDVSTLSTKSVTCMYAMFQQCETKKIDISNFNTTKVTNMTSMFSACESEVINVEGIDTRNVKNMHAMFSFCSPQSINLRGFNTSSVKDMSNMFEYCNTDSIDISSFDTRNVSDFSNMFNNCTVPSLDLSSFIINSGASVGKMFHNCKSKVKVTDHKLLLALELEG